ncbi:MAG: hypothetical protein M3140_09555 [Actinomycetota bacterium]|nr:hypothetical protein [Actinomycetota bacterium]
MINVLQYVRTPRLHLHRRTADRSPRRAVLDDEQFEVLESALAGEERLMEYLVGSEQPRRSERRRLRSVS